MKTLPGRILICLILVSCNKTSHEPVHNSLLEVLEGKESKPGNPDYLNTPYVTAGDRVYMVGHQDGSFPDLGWHVPGEMGGIWDHPIKLMDGFELRLDIDQKSIGVPGKEVTFHNYPYASKHISTFKNYPIIIERIQFVPDKMEGVVIEYTIRNSSNEEISAEVKFKGFVDLRPVWLSERLNWEDGKDEALWDDHEPVMVIKDPLHEWYTVIGTDLEIDNFNINAGGYHENANKGKGIEVGLFTNLVVPANNEISFRYFISGSYTSRTEAIATNEALKEDPRGLLEAKIRRYEMLASTASIDIPDKDIEDMYNWVKYNTDWLIRDVPEQGRALSAGIPDYPWWFGADNAYSLQGLFAAGMGEEALSTIDLILDLSEKENGNGRIIHEASTNGVVFNPGNLNETPHFIYTMWQVYEWTGDRAFLERVYPVAKKGLEWVEDQDKDSNGYPDGPGMMEIHGLHTEMIDVVVYLQKAYEATALMAEEIGDDQNASTYAKKALALKERINSEWWVEEAGSFADFRSDKKQALELIDDAIVRADTINKPWTVEELKLLKEEVNGYPSSGTRGFVVHHNWVVNTPMEMGIADRDKALSALETGRKYSSKYGIYVTGMDRQENQDESEKWEQFSYVGAVMTLPTGVQAISEANYGRQDQALQYLKMLHNSFGYALPGSLYEVSPDYGMITQAWTIYSVAYPIVNQFFGVNPRAHKKEIVIRPQMPSGWDNASMSNLPVGDNVISIAKTGNSWEIDQTQDGWTLILEVQEGHGDITVNGDPVSPGSEEGYFKIELTDLKNRVEIQ